MFEEEITITFAKPVTLKAGAAELSISELKLRDPVGGELEKASRLDTSTGVTIELITLITGHPRKLIERVPIRYLRMASDFFDQASNAGAEIEAVGTSE